MKNTGGGVMELKRLLEKTSYSLISLLLLGAGHVQAQTLTKPELQANTQGASYNLFSGRLRAMTGQSDNGFKAYSDKTAEQQDEYGVDLSSRYSNNLIDFDAGYELQERRFAEDSQESKSLLEGSANLLLGKPSGVADLRLSHSRTSLLKAPSQVNLTNNQDEREILTAAPSLRARLSAADKLQLSGDFTDIKYLETELLNSAREGVDLAWLHAISGIQKMQFSLQSVNIKFKHLVDTDYTMRQAMLGYRVNLRKLNYALDLGYSQSEPEAGEAFNSPTYNIKVGYITGLQEFTLSGAQVITDTSFGNGNSAVSGGVPSSDGSGAANGRLKRQESRFSWDTKSLCGRCDFSAALFAQRDTYLETLDQQSTQTGGGLNFAYRFTEAARLGMTLTRSDMKFEGMTNSEDYELSLARIDYRYAFRGGLSMSWEYKEERRKQEVKTQGYTERYLGAGLAYAF
jgi:hypothetical protein